MRLPRDIFDKRDEPERSTDFNLPNPLIESRHRLVIVNESMLNTHALPEKGKVCVGRAPDVEVFVPHPSVSRRHVLIHVDGKTVKLEDLGSSNGTSVNNRQLAPREVVVVGPADAIRIGKVVLVLQSEGYEPPTADASGTAKIIVAKAPPGDGDLEVEGRPVIVRAESMQRIYALVTRVAQTNMSVLVLGETGTGKEIVAHAIHARSSRRNEPFLAINCAALTESLLESELFGHEKGAFTGAHEAKLGLLEKAAGGTIFLDEIGDMSLSIQAKLLRVFEERAVLRLGSLKARALDVRFVTATNKDLAAEVAGGRFRKDFLYRLSGVTIHLPPLRERTAEILPLAQSFLERFAAEIGRSPVPSIATEALEKLARHSWPGNVRELRSVMERALLGCDSGPIGAEHVVFDGGALDVTRPVDSTETRRFALGPGGVVPEGLSGELETLERSRIVEALERSGGNQTKAAELLGMPRRTFVRKLAAYGIRRPRA
jgi:DNA-binding NtrC family response regulator